MSAMCKGGANTENHILTLRGRCTGCSAVHTARIPWPSQSGEQSRTEAGGGLRYVEGGDIPCDSIDNGRLERRRSPEG